MNKTLIALLTVIGLVTSVMVVFIVLGAQCKAKLATCSNDKEACLVNHERFKYGIPLGTASVNTPLELTVDGNKFIKVGMGKVGEGTGVRFHDENSTIESKITDMEDCISMCAATDACVGFNYSHNNNSCKLVGSLVTVGTVLSNISAYKKIPGLRVISP